MKKLFLIILSLFLLVGCNYNIDDDISNEELKDDNIEEDINEDIVEDVYIDDNPITVGIYNNYKLITEYDATLSKHKDIGSFYVFYTNDKKLISTNDKTNWNNYYKKYENIDKYKTGFYISFMVGDELIEHTVLDPSSQYAMTPYLFVYLYDDINQKDGAWYSHLEEKDVNENTIYSSIKLYSAGKGPMISSPITFTAFTYDEDDFDEDGKYRGNSSYTIQINTKK